MEYDFSGYATKNDLKCSDGRTIRKGAFKDNDGTRVPLVWQHMHDDPDNVLGHALLENRQDGVYAYCKFNSSPSGLQAKELVRHGDISALSIYANKLVQRGGDVLHGAIREVSLVLSGANPGAMIDNVSLRHGDDIETLEDEAIIYSGETLAHAGEEDPEAEQPTQETEPQTDQEKEPEVADEKTVGDVFETLNEEQKNVVYYMIAQAVDQALAGEFDDVEDTTQDEELAQSGINYGGTMRHNVFDGTGSYAAPSFSHSEIEAVFADAARVGSLKESVLAHAAQYGIENIDILFPDAKNITESPEFLARRMEWVNGVLGETHHTPFSRIKSTVADITADEARARGYVKGNLKKEEVIKLLKRVTTPTTIYKKQKLDRDDILDIKDFDVVTWLKAEMRIMLDEELARAILIGDGREAEHPDKIDEDCIRPIWTDDEMYAHHVFLDSTVDAQGFIDAVVRSRKEYRGSGSPVLYTSSDVLTDMLLLKDKMGRNLYENEDALAAALRVARIVEVEPMTGASRTHDVHGNVNLMAIIVNLKDYNVGTDQGGEVSMFDNFDIDYNQQKYLLEARCSGALTMPKSAIIVEKKTA